MRSWLLLVVLVACGGGGGNKPNKPTPPTPAGSGSATVADKSTQPAKPVEAPKPVDPMSVECKDMGCVITQMDVFANRVCDCKDKACADKVQADFTAWATKLSGKDELKDLKPSEAETQRIQTVVQKYTECTMKLMGGMDGDEDPPPVPNNSGLGGGLKK